MSLGRARRFAGDFLAIYDPEACTYATVTRMEGGPFSKWGSRPGAAHIRLKGAQQLHGWSKGRFQRVAFALAPRTFVLEARSFQQLHGRNTGRFQIEALVLDVSGFMARRYRMCNSYTDVSRDYR